MLVASKLNVYYDKKQILFDCSLSIESGERVLLVGPNGAGKSTFLKVIAGLHKHNAGEIKFSDNNISGWSPQRRINSGIGYLLQSNNIVPGLTVIENLRLGGYSLEKRLLEYRLEETLEAFALLKDKLDKRAGLLSGGERQALAISMVLMKRPALLLLDEPSAGLSPKTATEIIEHIKKAQDQMGIKAICMVEHNLRLTLQWATKLIVLVSGSVVHVSDNPAQYLKHNEELEKFYFGERGC